MFAVDMAGEKQISTVKKITESSFVSPMHRRLLTEWNDTETDLPQDNCVHELFETQVERAPNAVALVYNKGEVSYRELDNQANRVALHLRSLCVGPDVPVGICGQRTALPELQFGASLMRVRRDQFRVLSSNPGAEMAKNN